MSSCGFWEREGAAGCWNPTEPLAVTLWHFTSPWTFRLQDPPTPRSAVFVCCSAHGQPFVSPVASGDPQTRCVPAPWVTLWDEASSVSRSRPTQPGPGVPSLPPGKVGRAGLNPSAGRRSSLTGDTAGSERLTCHRCSHQSSRGRDSQRPWPWPLCHRASSRG